jgi:hypothetical protein
MLRTLIPSVSLLLCSCGIATHPLAVASVDHAMLYKLSVDNHELYLSSGHAAYDSGAIDAAIQPKLATAFERGFLEHPLIGRDHANWVRHLSIEPGSEHGKYNLVAKGLAPYPIRLSLINRTAIGDMLIKRIDSEPWNTGTHFATVSEKDFRLEDGSELIVRHEGAKQGFDSLLTIRLK